MKNCLTMRDFAGHRTLLPRFYMLRTPEFLWLFFNILRYVGIIKGITTTVGMIPGMVSPTITAALVPHVREATSV